MSRLIRSFFILLILVPSMLAGFTLVGAQDDATQIEIVGIIDAMTSSSITINDLLIDISVAEINTPLAVGTQVKVQGSLAAGGLIVAREVNDPLGNGTGDDGTPNPVDELEIRGVLSAINGTLYTIGGQVVDGSLAEIKAGVVVGAVVEAEARVSADGTWVAREIAAISPDDDDFSDVTQIEYVGTLNAIGADSVLVDTLTFMTVNAQMSPALMVGILVKVEGTVVDGVLVAREVRPATADDNSNDNSDDNGNDDNGNGNSNDNSDDNSDDNGNDDNGNDNVAVCPPVMPNGWTTYTVRAGDSLSRIAQITDTDFDDLVAVNCITNANSIIVGLVLFVEEAPRNGGGGSDDNGNGNSNSNDNGDDDNGNDNGSNSNNNSNDNGDDDHDDNGNDNGNNGNDDSGSDDDDD